MFSITGTHSVVRKEMIDRIQSLGASFNSTITR